MKYVFPAAFVMLSALSSFAIGPQGSFEDLRGFISEARQLAEKGHYRTASEAKDVLNKIRFASEEMDFSYTDAYSGHGVFREVEDAISAVVRSLVAAKWTAPEIAALMKETGSGLSYNGQEYLAALWPISNVQTLADFNAFLEIGSKALYDSWGARVHAEISYFIKDEHVMLEPFLKSLGLKDLLEVRAKSKSLASDMRFLKLALAQAQTADDFMAVLDPKWEAHAEYNKGHSSKPKDMTLIEYRALKRELAFASVPRFYALKPKSKEVSVFRKSSGIGIFKMFIAGCTAALTREPEQY